MKILMVCLGNICRSPLAEGVLRHKAVQAGLEWEVDSAGTGDWHVGEPPHPLSVRTALARGIDIGGQRGRQFVKEDLRRFDYIYFMEKANYKEARRIAGNLWEPGRCALLLDALYPGEARGVPDPYGKPADVYHHVFEMIDAACEAILLHHGATKKGNL